MNKTIFKDHEFAFVIGDKLLLARFNCSVYNCVKTKMMKHFAKVWAYHENMNYFKRKPMSM